MDMPEVNPKSVVVQLGAPKKPELFAPRVTLVSSLHNKDAEPIEYIVAGLFPKCSVTILAGPRDMGKTLACQMLMTACALGKPWFGRASRRCRSLAIFAEDTNDRLKERQERICKHFDAELIDLEEMESWIPDDDRNFVLYEAQSRFAQFGNPTFLWQQLATRCKSDGIELLILDNLGVIFRGDRWNDNQARDFIRFFNRQARELSCAIVVLVHPPKDRSSSYFTGSQTWENAARFAMSFDSSEPEDPRCGDRVIKIRKSNYTDWSDPMRHEGIALEWDDGVLVTRNIPSSQKILSAFDKIELDGKIVEAVRRAVDLGWKIAADPNSPNSMPARLSTQKQWQHIKRYDLVGSIERSIAAGKLVKVAVDRTWMLCLPGQHYLGESPPA